MSAAAYCIVHCCWKLQRKAASIEGEVQGCYPCPAYSEPEPDYPCPPCYACLPWHSQALMTRTGPRCLVTILLHPVIHIIDNLDNIIMIGIAWNWAGISRCQDVKMIAPAWHIRRSSGLASMHGKRCRRRRKEVALQRLWWNAWGLRVGGKREEQYYGAVCSGMQKEDQ